MMSLPGGAANSNRATNTPIDIIHSGGTSTVTKDQTINGSQWNLLGTYTFSGNAEVKVRNIGTNGYVVADAITILKAGTPDVAADIDNAFEVVKSGTWTTSTSLQGYRFGGDYYHDNNASKGSLSISYKAVINPGTYEVFAWWAANSNRASNTPFDIMHSSGTTTVTKNQQVDGSQWNSLGTYTFSSTAEIRIRNAGTNGYVVADAIMLEEK